MISRPREQFVVFLGLIAVNTILGWYLFWHWRDYQGRTRWIYSAVEPAASVTPTSQASKVEAQTFAEIVARNLFRPDRVNESPTENAKMPDLPFLSGTMNLGSGSFALMAPGDQPSGLSKRVVPGEEIGGYKLVSIAGSQVVVEWGGKKVTVDVSESARRVPRVIERTEKTVTARPPVIASPAAPSAQVTTVLSSPPANAGQRKSNGPAGYNAPAGASADAPAGTVIAGKKKVVEEMFGVQKVYWVDVGQPGGPAEKQQDKK